MSGALKINVDAFYRRAARLYEAWRNAPADSGFAKSDAIACAVGTEGDTSYTKSGALQTWLFGYEVPDTVTLFCIDKIVCLASKRKLDFLRQLEHVGKKSSAEVPAIEFMERKKDAEADRADMQKLLGLARKSRAGRCVGELSRDRFGGDFHAAWSEILHGSGAKVETVDVSSDVSALLSVKEESELDAVRVAATATSKLFSSHLKQHLVTIVDQDRKVKHEKLAEFCDDALQNKRLVDSVPASSDAFEMCYTPVVQSGGNYALKFTNEFEKQTLSFDCIITMLGVRYKSYCANLIRTILIDPTDEQRTIYEYLVDLQELLVDRLRDGAKVSDAVRAVTDKCGSERPDLLPKLTKAFGFAIGIEFRDANYQITAKNDAVLRRGVVLNVQLGFAGLEAPSGKDSKKKTYALFVADTVLVGSASEAPTVLTAVKKRLKHIAMFIKDDTDARDNAAAVDDEKENAEDAPMGIGAVIGRRRAAERAARSGGKNEADDRSAEERRTEHQAELANRINSEAQERMRGARTDREGEKRTRKNAISYKSVAQFPAREPDVRDARIFVDKKYETLVLPVFGTATPFHIATIKNVSQSVEGEYTYLRVNFFHPGATVTKEQLPGPANSPPDVFFVKELTFRASTDRESGAAANLVTSFRLIKEVQKRYKTREAEEREKEGIVKQDTLVTNPNRTNPKLKDLYIRPLLTSKRITGTLEAHVNGFRFTSIRGDKVDILYNNVKHAFFQPCDKELIILLHFHLRNAIMFGKKKHTDVQFYTEVGETITDLGRQHNMHDTDELLAEQAERELRTRLKQAFRTFCDKVETITKDVEFEIPYRDLGFTGSTGRSTVFLQPSSSCLVNLTEWPPVTITLDEVELVHFERVSFQLKNFDIVFVFKDYSRKVATISSVPMNVLDHIKEWLNSCDLYYTEGIQSLNWPKIMKTIQDDAEGFFENGGWDFLKADAGSDDEDDDDDEEDEVYEPSGGSSAGGSPAGSEESESVGDGDEEGDADEDWSAEESDSSPEDEEEDEEEGKDWDELERDAERADREHGAYSSDEERRRKHGGAGGGAGAGGGGMKRKRDSDGDRPASKRRR